VGAIPYSKTASSILRASSAFSARALQLKFHPPVQYVYNPLLYARASYSRFVRRYAGSPTRVLFLGMNPGPWGMAQTGIPFGEVGMVRDWMCIRAAVGHPPKEHPRVPVRGFDCTRSEVSGSRFWGLMRNRFPDPVEFFREHFVANYCPLLFLDKDGRNITPDKIAGGDREALFRLCDVLFLNLVKALSPRWVIGIGAFALKRIRSALESAMGMNVAMIPHPSPASPQANRDWAGQAVRALAESGAWAHRAASPDNTS
jgi:single-strand selective monofunctional uracil DNA glycosylase